MSKRHAVLVAYTSGALAVYLFVVGKSLDEDDRLVWVAFGGAVIVMLCALIEAFSEFPSSSGGDD